MDRNSFPYIDNDQAAFPDATFVVGLQKTSPLHLDRSTHIGSSADGGACFHLEEPTID